MEREKAAPAPEVTLVTPMYNEAARIAANLEVHARNLERFGVPWEIVVVDDGSRDGSAEAVRRVAAAEPRVRLVSYAPNRGRGYALRQGFGAARGRFVITTESDLSYGPEVIEAIYRALAAGEGEVVVASPYMEGGRLDGVPPLRHFLSRTGNRILCFSLGGSVTTASGMTRGYRREVLEALDLESDDKEIHLEILSKVLTLGFRVAEVPAVLTWPPHRGKGRGRGSTFKLGKFVLSHLLFSFEEYPFLLFGSLGGLLFLVGAAFGLAALVLSLQGHPVGNRPLTLGAVLLVLFGLQILVFSFLSLQNRNLAKRMVRLTMLVRRLEGERDGGGPR